VVRRAEAERPIPVYVLTDKGRDVIARLIAGDPARIDGAPIGVAGAVETSGSVGITGPAESDRPR